MPKTAKKHTERYGLRGKGLQLLSKNPHVPKKYHQLASGVLNPEEFEKWEKKKKPN